MWTLYDPLARETERRGRSVEPKLGKDCQGSARQLPTSLQKLWFLLEPINSVSCRIGAVVKNR